MSSQGAEDPRFWDRLLAVVEEKRVIPILGEDLLTVTIDGRPVLLYRYLAERLAEYLGLSTEGLPDTGALHEVACRFLAKQGDLDDIYPALKTLFPAPEHLTLPLPLRQLAEIRSFQLFVTTTFDPLLAQAVNEARFGGRPGTRVIAYTPWSDGTEPVDLDRPLARIAEPVVFHLFGRLAAIPQYAVTEEDTLEVVHSLQSESLRPSFLIDELRRGQLLLLGSRFPDWLARFFLRVANRDRLWLVRGKSTFVADDRMRAEPSLVEFLKHFSAQTQLFPGSAADLVAGLSRRWTERHPPETTPEPPPPPPDIEPGAVFLSYASEDREIVEKLKGDLDREDVPAWFDRDRLEAGDPFEPKIRASIKLCTLFVPILSKHTLTPGRRFFRVEWSCAEREAEEAPPNQTFIMPVVIDDDVKPDDPRIPERFRSVQWHRLPPDRSTGDLVDLLKRRLKAYQRLLVEAR